MNKIFFYLFVIVELFYLDDLKAQLTYRPNSLERLSRSTRGFSLGIGTGITQISNSKYYSQVKSGQISPGIGFSLDAKYNKHPFSINLSLFSSNFSLESPNLIDSDDEVNVKHTGMELGLNMALLHFTRWLVPFIGMGYQKSVLGSGITWLGIEDEEKAEYLYVSNTSCPIIRAGCGIHISQINLEFVYKRSLFTEKAFNQLSGSIFYNGSFTRI